MLFVEVYGLWIDGRMTKVEEQLKKLPFSKNEIVFAKIIQSSSNDLNGKSSPFIRITGHETYTEMASNVLKPLGYKLCIINTV